MGDVRGLTHDDPGRWRRRALTFSITFIAAAVVLGTAPLTLPLVALIDLIRRSRLAWTRTLAMVAWILACEIWGLLASLMVWIARPCIGRARFVAANFWLQATWTSALLRGALLLFSMRLEIRGGEAAAQGPYLLLVRHASSGDPLLPMVAVAVAHRLRPRFVLKEELRWDPCLDVVGQRLPNAFIRRGGGSSEVERSAALTEDLGARDVIVLFPEGTRFSRRGRERRLAELAARRDPLVDRADALRHTIPPRSGGVAGILQRAPHLDVVFLAHTGLDRVRSVAELLRGELIGVRIEVEFWRVPAASIPTDDDGRRRWLFAEWARVDQWIAERTAP